MVPAGDGVLIGGFIISGTESKQVLVRAVGPSLDAAGINAIPDPLLSLRDSTGALVAENDDWEQTQQDAIAATGIPPLHAREAAIVATLAPGAYTAVVAEKSGSAGIALVEVYDVGGEQGSRLANISTRGSARAHDEVMIGGFIVAGDAPAEILIRVLGPSLRLQDVAEPLSDPTLQLVDHNGEVIRACGDWAEDSAQAAAIRGLGMAPAEASEAGMIAQLAPGLYTIIAAGAGGATGDALVEVYHLQQ